jgi:hypothetical protein
VSRVGERKRRRKRQKTPEVKGRCGIKQAEVNIAQSALEGVTEKKPNECKGGKGSMKN